MAKEVDNDMVTVLREVTMAQVRSDDRDLSTRQMAVLMTCGQGAATIRGLAADLRIGKPSVTRAVDRLEALGLARRQPDPGDRRSVLVRRTADGTAYVRWLGKTMADAMRRTARVERAAA